MIRLPEGILYAILLACYHHIWVSVALVVSRITHEPGAAAVLDRRGGAFSAKFLLTNEERR